MDNSETSRATAARKSSPRKGTDGSGAGTAQESKTFNATENPTGAFDSQRNGSTTGAQSQRLMDKVRDQASAQFATQKDKATQGIGSVVQAVRQTTQQLRDQQHPTAAGYVEQVADQLDRFSKQLQEKDLNRLIADARQLARRQPALFVGGAFAVGLLGARFLKSSRPEQPYGGYAGSTGSLGSGGGGYRSYSEVHDDSRIRSSARARDTESQTDESTIRYAGDISKPENP